jgi:hypothetical protein
MSRSIKSGLAKDAIAYFKLGIEGKPAEYGAKNIKEKLKARQVGYSLALLWQLVDQHAKKLDRRSPTQRAASAIREVEGLLDALVTGSDHPIFEYVLELRSDDFRPQKAGANITGRRRRAAVAGFILAYQKAADLTEIAAARVVAKGCRSNAFSLGKSEHDDEAVAQSIRKWIPRSAPSEVQKYQDQIMARAAAIAPQDLDVPLALRIYLAGRDLVWEMWSVPV